MSSGAGSSREHAAQGDPTQGETNERAKAYRPLRHDVQMCNCTHADDRGCLATIGYPGLGYGRCRDLCMFCEAFEDGPMCRCPCRVCRHPETRAPTPDVDTVWNEWEAATCRKIGYCKYPMRQAILEYDACVYYNGPQCGQPAIGGQVATVGGTDLIVTNLSYVQTPEGFANEGEHDEEPEHDPAGSTIPPGAEVVDLTTLADSEAGDELQIVDTWLAPPSSEDDEDAELIPSDHVSYLRRAC